MHALLVLLLMASPALAAEYSICGKGPRINGTIDGDTIWHDRQKIRLMGFDTPEKGGRAQCKRERGMADKATTRLQALHLNRRKSPRQYSNRTLSARGVLVLVGTST